MPSRLLNASQRATIAKLLLRTLSQYAAAHHGTARFGAVCDEVILCAAIIVGQSEQRPMTAAKLADYVGIPRSTVVRRLQSMERRGMVTLDGGAARLAEDHVNNPKLIAAIDSITQIIRKTAMELSKMDTTPLALLLAFALWS